MGVMTYELPLFGEGARISLPAWHFDQVHVAPPDARVIARSEFCTYAGLAYSDRAISFQAHPEFSTRYLADLIAHYAGQGLPPHKAAAATQTLDRAVDRALIKQILRRFLAP